MSSEAAVIPTPGPPSAPIPWQDVQWALRMGLHTLAPKRSGPASASLAPASPPSAWLPPPRTPVSVPLSASAVASCPLGASALLVTSAPASGPGVVVSGEASLDEVALSPLQPVVAHSTAARAAGRACADEK